MKKCPNCGNAISEYAVSCPNCGVNLSGSENKTVVITKDQIKEKKHKKQEIEMIVNIALLIVAIIFPQILGTSLGWGISTPLPMLACGIAVIYSVYIIVKYQIVNLFSIKEKIIVIGISGLLIAIIGGCTYMNYTKVLVGMSFWEYLSILTKISYIMGNLLLACCYSLLWIESYCFVKSMRKSKNMKRQG